MFIQYLFSYLTQKSINVNYLKSGKLFYNPKFGTPKMTINRPSNLQIFGSKLSSSLKSVRSFGKQTTTPKINQDSIYGQTIIPVSLSRIKSVTKQQTKEKQEEALKSIYGTATKSMQLTKEKQEEAFRSVYGTATKSMELTKEKQLQIPFIGQGEIQKQKQRERNPTILTSSTKFSSLRLPPAKKIPTPPNIPIFAFPFGNQFSRKQSFKSAFKFPKIHNVYKPSLAGIGLNIKQFKIPKIFTGIEIRGIPATKKRRR